MLMNLSLKKKGAQGSSVFFRGRTGHRAARINDSILVVGGTDVSGRAIGQVDRINCLSNKIDSVIMDSSISLQGFSLFSFEDTLFIWGGLHLRQHINALLHFDGNKFIPLQQHAPVPKPRAYHASTLIAAKYLIVFAGSDGHSFFNDWNLLNLKTLEWKTLTPSLQIGYNLGSSMVWVNGRGILLVNQIFDEASKSIIWNSFYEFYVKDYNSGELQVSALEVGVGVGIFEEYVFNHMTVYDNSSILILGGYKGTNSDMLHNFSYILYVDEMRLEKTKFKFKEKSQFQTIYHKNKLFLIGGITSKQEMEHSLQIYQSHPHHHHFKRNVCTTCKLYFDEEWFRTSKEVFPSSKVKQDYDYNYHLRLDNRIIAKFSAYITNQVYALTLLIQNLKKLTSNHIEINYHKFKEDYSRFAPEMAAQTYQYLKIGSTFTQLDANLLINQLIMLQQRQAAECVSKDVIELCLLRLKMAIYRLGHSCLFTIRLNRQQSCIIYFSYSQLECSYSNFTPFNHFHYYYNSRTKECSSQTNKHIIYSNIKHIIKDPHQYQSIQQNAVSIIIFCGDQIENQFNLFQQNWDQQTGETHSFPTYNKEQKRVAPLLQLSFLPIPHQFHILIEETPLYFINILPLLQTDCKNKILGRIDQYDSMKDKGIVKFIEVYQYPGEYWLQKILIYHCNRLIMHYQQPKINTCGVIVIKEEVELDLSGNRFARLEDQLMIKNLIQELRSFKRCRSFE